MKKMKENKGITLIALAVTVVVLLILVGVTISQVTGNGIFNKSSAAKDNTNKVEERSILNTSVVAAIGKSNRAKVEEVYLRNNIEKNIGQEGEKYTLDTVQDGNDSKHYEVKFLPTQNEYVILEDGTVLSKDEYNGQISTDSNDLLIIEVGESKEISVETDSNAPVTWRSSNENVAYVRNEDITNTKVATIYGKSNGENIEITATLTNGKKVTRKVKVQTNPKSVTITNKDNLLIDLGLENKTLQLQAKIEPSTANVNTNLTWTSNDPRKATVDRNGKVTGKANGNVTITVVTGNGKEDTCQVLVRTSPISIALEPNNVTLDLNGTKTKKLTVKYNPDTVDTNRSITWSSNNSNIVSVDGDGNITAKALGTATITARTPNQKTATCTVNVKISPTSISINPNGLALDLSGTTTGNLRVKYNPETSNLKTGITWTSSKTEIATIDSSGKVIGKSNGTTTITAKTENGKTATCNVTVYTSPKSISVNPNNLTLDMSGTKTRKLTVSYNPTSSDSKKQITWSSSNNNTATVDAAGNVTGRSNGNVTITAKTENGKIATCNVKVQTSLNSISLNKTSTVLDINTKKTERLTVNYNPSTANVNTGISWSSSNPSAVTVDGSGNITAVATTGSAIITARAQNGSTATCTVTLKTLVTTISVSSSVTVETGATTTISARAAEDNPTENLTWISTNPNIVSVSPDGTWSKSGIFDFDWWGSGGFVPGNKKKNKWYATLTGKAQGTAQIIVKGEDGRILGTCNVTVIKIVRVNLDEHHRNGEGWFSDWSGTIDAGAKRVEIETSSRLVDAWRDRRITFTYSGNGSHTWQDYLDGSFGNDPSESSSETVTLNGGTRWNISIYMSTGLGNGFTSAGTSAYVSGSLKFYY